MGAITRFYNNCQNKVKEKKGYPNKKNILLGADSYYVQFDIKLDPRDTIQPLTPSGKTTGIDIGLKFLLVDIAIPNELSQI